MYRMAEDARVLLRTTREIHTERHGAHTFEVGSHLPLEDAALRSGIRTNRPRYDDALAELTYEGVILPDPSARHARGGKHYVITRRGLEGVY